MFRVLALAVFLSFPVFAQVDPSAAPGAPVPMAVAPATAVALDGGVTVAVTGTPVAAPGDPLANPLGSIKNFYIAAKEGKWALAAALLLFVVVGGIRMFGKRVHTMLVSWLGPDTPWDKPFWFLFQTKVGGWLLNWLTAIGAALSMASMSGMVIDSHAWRTAVIASSGGTVLIELKDDLKEWWAGPNWLRRLLKMPVPEMVTVTVTVPASTVKADAPATVVPIKPVDPPKPGA